MGFSATLSRTRRSFACVPLLCTLAALPTAALARAPHSGGGSGGIGVSGGAAGGSSATGGSAGTTGTGTTGNGTSTTGATGSGTAITGGSATPSAQATTGGRAATGVIRLSGVVNASGDGITLTVAASGIRGRPLTIGGSAPATDAGATIAIEAARTGTTGWTEVAAAVISSSGAFTAEWTPVASAQVALRAVLAPGVVVPEASTLNGGGGLPGSGGSASTAASELATSTLTIPIFQNARATIYGPGLWGRRTACGERLRKRTLGVASRTLRCGARVAVFFRGREITVPVIDRGPFANGARWDLTMATARALGVRGTVTVGTLSPAPPAHT